MRDDEQFNINFVKTIETYKCLYDYTRSDYKNIHIQEKAWQDIATQFTETVSSCKERWRNLRGCFTRHLKQTNASASGAKYRKPYYLAGNMQFILPFTKTRKLSTINHHSNVKCEQRDSSGSSENISSEYTVTTLTDNENKSIKTNTTTWASEDDEITLENFAVQPSSKDDNNILIATSASSVTASTPLIVVSNDGCSGQKRKFDDLSTTTTLEYNTVLTKSQTENYAEYKRENSRDNNSSEQANSEADWFFLKSLLPDINSMNQSQKRKLRIHFLNIIDNILSENQTSITF